MTDTTVISQPRRLDVTSEAARKRLRSRYRAEARFKLYGLTAIALAVLFLTIVLVDILVKGLPAFWQYQLSLPVTVDAAVVDPQATKQPEVLRAANYTKLARDALRRQFPEVTQRGERKLLDGLLSSGATDVLREQVVADPSLVGTDATVPLLLSDDADLHLKGQGTAIVRHPTLGAARPSGTTGEITIEVSAGDFTERLAAIKQVLARQAARAAREASRLEVSLKRARSAIADLQREIGQAGAAGDAALVQTLSRELAGRQSEAASLEQALARASARLSALKNRAEASATAETLDDTLPSLLVAINDGLVKLTGFDAKSASGRVLLPLRSSAEAPASAWQILSYETPESDRRVSDLEVAWLERLKERGLVERAFNWRFFTAADSREPELAGIKGALIGSALTLLVTLVLCLPVGVAAAVYLEEFAPKNRLTELIEVNINNLAAVPSIVFGLLGLAVFLNFFGLPRSAPIVGGLVLALLVLPTIIIASRAALKAVPPSIKEAALGVGASHQQAVFHHVLPLALPGIMTGTIIGMAHALGETAPLLMIGMVAFIVQPPEGFLDAATALPVQIYLWSDLPEIAFQAKTAAAIIVLLVFLFAMNGLAIVLRKRFERRW